MQNSENKLEQVAGLFAIPGHFLGARPHGRGHINDTFAVSFHREGKVVRYIFQRINSHVFKDPVKLMDNILRVTRHGGKTRQKGKQCLSLRATRDGQCLAVDDEGACWRVYDFVEQTICREKAASAEEAFQVGQGFGRFQQALCDLTGPRLHEVIPDFHNTPERYRALAKAVRLDPLGRARQCQREIDFALEREQDAGLLAKLAAEGSLPERICHNDTKINNLLLDASSGHWVCVIDLDTVMPGLVHYDFGDMVRTATFAAGEDESDPDLNRIHLDMFEALLQGYLEAAGSFLTPLEKELLPMGGRIITLETGVRFLTDYLLGDIYFKTSVPEHNLARCRNQLQRVRSIEANYEAMIEQTLRCRQSA